MTAALTDLSHRIKDKARELGFDACGIAPASQFPELANLKGWLEQGYAGTMRFLERTADQRADVRGALPSAKSVIVTATLYNTGEPFSLESPDGARAHVSRYAWGDDYHPIVMRRLDALVGWMHQQHDEPFEAAPYVDTGPVQERVLAQYAGVGWVGKNCCVINPALGSFLFLGEILCSLPLTPDAPALDQCGACTLCIDSCPTEALVAPRVLDARRCVSYLTIEHNGEVPAELSRDIGTHVYGCDVCQEVCPYNAAAPVSTDPSWLPRPQWKRRSVDDLLQMPREELRAGLRGSAMTRARPAVLRRNVERAAANASNPAPAGNASGRSHS
jgi:epoxyqueuosine reductase